MYTLLLSIVSSLSFALTPPDITEPVQSTFYNKSDAIVVIGNEGAGDGNIESSPKRSFKPIFNLSCHMKEKLFFLWDIKTAVEQRKMSSIWYYFQHFQRNIT